MSSITRNGFTVTLTVTLTVTKTEQVAGEPMNGSLVILNNTGKTVALPCLADGTLQAGIGNAKVPYNPVSGAVACSSQLEPGKSVYPQVILTTYDGCNLPGTPACTSSKSPAPLPVGNYTTAINWVGMPAQVPQPAPIKVVLVSSSGA